MLSLMIYLITDHALIKYILNFFVLSVEEKNRWQYFDVALSLL